MITFEFLLPKEISEINSKKIVNHLYEGDDVIIFQEYLYCEEYIHLENDSYLWVWTDKNLIKSGVIFGITTDLKTVEITREHPDFGLFTQQLKQYISKKESSEDIKIIINQDLGDEPYDNEIVQKKMYELVALSDEMYRQKFLSKFTYTHLLYCTNKAFKRDITVDGKAVFNKSIAYTSNEAKKYYELLPDTRTVKLHNHLVLDYINPIADIIEDLLKIKNDVVKINLFYLLTDNLLI